MMSKHTSNSMILYYAERKRTSKKMGCQRKGSPACCHLLCKVTGAPGNQGKGCTQTSTAAADGFGGCMCMSIPAKRNKRKVVRNQGWFLVFLYLESKHLGLDPAPYETKHKPHWLQETPGQVTRDSSSLGNHSGDWPPAWCNPIYYKTLSPTHQPIAHPFCYVFI